MNLEIKLKDDKLKEIITKEIIYKSKNKIIIILNNWDSFKKFKIFNW